MLSVISSQLDYSHSSFWLCLAEAWNWMNYLCVVHKCGGNMDPEDMSKTVRNSWNWKWSLEEKSKLITEWQQVSWWTDAEQAWVKRWKTRLTEGNDWELQQNELQTELKALKNPKKAQIRDYTCNKIITKPTSKTKCLHELLPVFFMSV